MLNAPVPSPQTADALDHTVRSMLKLSKVSRYSKRTMLLSQGQNVSTIYILISGWVRLFSVTEEGQEPVIDLMTRGTILGFDALSNNSVMGYHAEVVSDEVSVFEVPLQMLKDSIAENAALGSYFVSLFASQIVRLQQHIERISSVSAQQRVVSFLLDLSDGSGKPFALPCEKSLIASYLGMKRETFSRVLSQLKKSGVQVQGNIVTIMEPGLLQSGLSQSHVAFAA